MEMDFSHHAWSWSLLAAATAGLITALHSSLVFAGRAEIFEVRRTLQMSAKDPVYKDYYINAGRDAGIRQRMIVEVVRMVPVYDSIHDVGRGEMELPMGRIQIIYVGDRMSVGRGYAPAHRVENPVAGTDSIMIGDRLDLGGAYMERPEFEDPTATPIILKPTASEELKPAQAEPMLPAVPVPPAPPPAVVIGPTIKPAAPKAPAAPTEPKPVPQPAKELPLKQESLPSTKVIEIKPDSVTPVPAESKKE